MADDRSRPVRDMFAAIAGRYDLLNHFLSAGTDGYWRWYTLRRMKRLNPAPRFQLDLCCGTGDLTRLMARLGPVTGCDFCHPMLVIARRKFQSRPARHRVDLVEGDGLRLPFPDGTFDTVVVAFGVRNYASLDEGLAEIFRVLRPGGWAGILEFSHPWLPVRVLFNLYFHHLLPRLGRWISGHGSAYRYLPDSVRQFPRPAELQALLEAAGFTRAAFRRLTAGIAALHTGRRPER